VVGGFAPEVLDFAVYLGIDPEREEDLLWIAHECLNAELPTPWTEHTSSRGDVYFYNAETDESVVEHPLEEKYRAMVEDEKRKRLTGAQDRAAAPPSHGGWSEGGGAADLDDSESAVPIAHSEVVDMALYFDVDPAKETWLLQTVREAVLAPLPWMFCEVTDSSGDPYYYNSVTDESQREHPLDKFFQDRLATERDAADDVTANADDAWQVFFSSNGSPYFHNFATGEEVRDAPDCMSADHVRQQIRRDAASRQAQLLGKPRAGAGESSESLLGAQMSGDWQDMGEDPYEGIPDEEVQQMAEMLGLRPSDPKLIKFMRELHAKKVQGMQGKTWTTEVYDENKVDMQPPKMRPPPKPPSPARLVFYSWWYEEGVKKYMELQYDMTKHLFYIILNKTVALKEVKIAGPLASLALPLSHAPTRARVRARVRPGSRALSGSRPRRPSRSGGLQDCCRVGRARPR
jgi:centrosomal protein CEP164